MTLITVLSEEERRKIFGGSIEEFKSFVKYTSYCELGPNKWSVPLDDLRAPKKWLRLELVSQWMLVEQDVDNGETLA